MIGMMLQKEPKKFMIEWLQWKIFHCLIGKTKTKQNKQNQNKTKQTNINKTKQNKQT